MLRILTAQLPRPSSDFTGAASAQNYPWKPEKPITMIVPWAAGGSTDQVTPRRRRRDRKGARPEGRHRQSAAARPARSAPRTRWTRRRTATPGPPAPRRTSAPTPSAACSTPRSPTGGSISASSTCRCSASTPTRRTRPPQDLVDAMKAKPGAVSVATAGINSSGHAAIEAFTRALGLTYKHVTL